MVRTQGSRPKSAFSLSTMHLAAHLGPRDVVHFGPSLGCGPAC